MAIAQPTASRHYEIGNSLVKIAYTGHLSRRRPHSATVGLDAVRNQLLLLWLGEHWKN